MKRVPVTVQRLLEMKRQSAPITMVTAYEYGAARIADRVGLDVLLVGDSLGMAVLGYDSTLPVTLADILSAARAVSRGSEFCMVIADLPFGSYEAGSEQGLQAATALMKEGGVHGVKLEGGNAVIQQVTSRVTGAGIPVMSHIGLTPQSVHQLGGYRVQGRSADGAAELLRQARSLEEAGAFAIVLECVPAQVAAEITSAVGIPVIGIGAGSATDGQVLVWHDLLGLTLDHVPKFVKAYADLGTDIERALSRYAAEVRDGTFPSEEHAY